MGGGGDDELFVGGEGELDGLFASGFGNLAEEGGVGEVVVAVLVGLLFDAKFVDTEVLVFATCDEKIGQNCEAVDFEVAVHYALGAELRF